MVALNKTYQKTLTPDRSAKDSGHRYYSPEISRWLSRDPIGERRTGNLYAFVGNKPISRADALGLIEIVGISASGQPVSSDTPWPTDEPIPEPTTWPPAGPISPPSPEGYDYPPPGQCSIRLCCTPVHDTPIRHCYVRIQYDNGRLFGCRGGLPEGCPFGAGEPYPSHCSRCCGRWGPIVTQCGTPIRGGGTPLDQNFDNTSQRCRLLETSASACTTVRTCLENRANLIEGQCYRYRLLLGARNSNTVVHHLLSHCLTGGPYASVPLPSGVDAPGWRDFNERDERCPMSALEALTQ
jgi:RHS repeat-associated protein